MAFGHKNKYNCNVRAPHAYYPRSGKKLATVLHDTTVGSCKKGGRARRGQRGVDREKDTEKSFLLKSQTAKKRREGEDEDEDEGEGDGDGDGRRRGGKGGGM
jgi:hypothetical protein